MNIIGKYVLGTVATIAAFLTLVSSDVRAEDRQTINAFSVWQATGQTFRTSVEEGIMVSWPGCYHAGGVRPVSYVSLESAGYLVRERHLSPLPRGLQNGQDDFEARQTPSFVWKRRPVLPQRVR